MRKLLLSFVCLFVCLSISSFCYAKGVKWEDDVRLTNDPSASTTSEANVWCVATDSQNRVHVVWEDYRDGYPEIYYKRSLDGGTSWEPDTRLTFDGGASYNYNPSITTDSQNRVHVVWFDNCDSKWEIYYKRSLDGGSSWEPDTRLTFDGAWSAYPSIATDSQNMVHVVWEDERDGNYEIYYKRGNQAAKWTVMVYCAADNNLDLNGVEDLNELEYAGSNDDVNMIYLLDRYGMNDTKLYYVENDPNANPDGSDMNIISQDISQEASSWLAQEEDMGNPQTLQDFCLWTMQNYPAEHYILSIWDHGNGIFLLDEEDAGIFKGECWDEHGGIPGEYIDLAELRDVLEQLYIANGNKKIDIVSHDACVLGQIETHYQMKDYVDYGIASEEYVPGDGGEYGYPFKELINNPDMTAQELCSHIVSYFGQRYQNDPLWPNATLAGLDLQALEDSLIPAVNYFSGYLYSFMNNFSSEISQTRANTETYNTDGQNPELYHFAQLISQNQGFPLELKYSASQLQSQYPQTVIAEWHGTGSANAHGMTIWFPEYFTNNIHYNDYLTKIDFKDEKWDEFLQIYESPYEVLSITVNTLQSTVPKGKYLRYSVSISNLSWVSHTIKAWTEITIPNGNTYPYLGPAVLSVGAGQNLQGNLAFYIPLSAPLGLYTYAGKISTIDDFLLDEDYFDFTVVK